MDRERKIKYNSEMIKIFRKTTDTTIVIDSPINLNNRKHISMEISMYLNSWVDYHFPGFEIIDFV